MDDYSIGATQGVPWVFDRLSLLSTFDGRADDGALTGFSNAGAGQRRGELPLEQSLIQLP